MGNESLLLAFLTALVDRAPLISTKIEKGLHSKGSFSLYLSPLYITLCDIIYILYTQIHKTERKKKMYDLSNVWILPELERSEGWCSKGRSPHSVVTFPTPPMDFLNPLDRTANTAACPIKWSNTDVACLCLPLAICRNKIASYKKFCPRFILKRNNNAFAYQYFPLSLLPLRSSSSSLPILFFSHHKI